MFQGKEMGDDRRNHHEDIQMGSDFEQRTEKEKLGQD